MADGIAEARELIRVELRKGSWLVTPGGLKFWPALDMFNQQCSEYDELSDFADYAGRFLRATFVDNDESNVRPEWIDDLLSRLERSNVS